MTNSEICRSFLQAADRRKQINVLADLTMQTPQNIKMILCAAGIDPAAPTPKYQKTKAESVGCEIALPAEIRNEVVNYVNKRHRVRRR